MSPWEGEAALLADRIAAFVRGSLAGAPPEPFDRLLTDVSAWQVANDPVLARIADPGEVPAVPVGVLKDPGLGTARGQASVVFRTSGTTTGARGEHHLRSTALYDLGSVAWARRCVPHLPDRIEALLEDPAERPDSSLSHMVRAFGGPARWHVREGRLLLDGLARPLPERCFVPATAFALAEWIEHAPPPLPAGSVLMVTGGYKGRIRSIAAEHLLDEARRQLRPAAVVLEYGMTELSSQLWATPGTGFLPPPWLRVVAIRPETGEPVAPGEAGQLRFYDLCNLDGPVGLETLDLGTVRHDGSIDLHGRLPGSPARGCSLTIEEARP